MLFSRFGLELSLETKVTLWITMAVWLALCAVFTLVHLALSAAAVENTSTARAMLSGFAEVSGSAGQTSIQLAACAVPDCVLCSSNGTCSACGNKKVTASMSFSFPTF